MLEHFQDLQIRHQPQRLQILELLNDLMSKHRNALKELGNESVVGITDLVIGEKDPRNLMVIFSILKGSHGGMGYIRPCRGSTLFLSLEICSRFVGPVRLRLLLFPHHLSTASR